MIRKLKKSRPFRISLSLITKTSFSRKSLPKGSPNNGSASWLRNSKRYSAIDEILSSFELANKFVTNICFRSGYPKFIVWSLFARWFILAQFVRLHQERFLPGVGRVELFLFRRQARNAGDGNEGIGGSVHLFRHEVSDFAVDLLFPDLLVVLTGIHLEGLVDF